MKKNQLGFGTIETLLIVVIVGIVGTVGWFVYNSQKKTNDILDKTTQSQSELQKVISKHYCHPEEKLCFDYPEDWSFKLTSYNNKEVVPAVSSDSIELHKGTMIISMNIPYQPGVVGECVNDRKANTEVSYEELPNLKGVYMAGAKNKPATITLTDQTEPKYGPICGQDAFIYQRQWIFARKQVINNRNKDYIQVDAYTTSGSLSEETIKILRSFKYE